MRAHVARIFIAAFTIVTLASHAPSARADGDDVKGNIAGTVGLGLLGAEVGLLLPPAFKLQDRWWAWVLFPTLGAAAGAIPGALLFDEGSPDPAITVSLLGAGMALAIPAIVGAVSWKNRRDNAEPQMEGGAVIRLGKVGSRWGVPSIGAAPVYTAAEQSKFGLSQRNFLKLPLVSGRF